MITTIFATIFYSSGFVIFLLGLQSLISFPLTLAYEVWKWKTLKKMPTFKNKVSILVPAYNEERTIRATVLSILDSDYPDKEVIVINDGSTDKTEEKIKDLIEEGRIIYRNKPNGGKASALNKGIELASGKVVIFTDADSLFLPETVSQMVRWFGIPSIDAVCGNDVPLHPVTPIQKLLAITTHIGTGFVRRALSVIGCLPIITGNLGAIRTSVLKEIKGFKEIWGEDLEITFRLHKYKKRIIFDPDPKVMAECPGTLRALWKQRTRWMRSYIKVAFLHKDLFFKPMFKPFSFYLPINFLNMTIVPLLQTILVIFIPFAFALKQIYVTGIFEVFTYFGLIFFFMIAVYSISLDRNLGDLIYMPYGILILPLSYFYNAVITYSWWKELGKAEEKWEKIERRKIVTVEKKEVKGWKLALAGLLLIITSSTATYYYLTYLKGETFKNIDMKRLTPPVSRPAFNLAISTHFDAWGDWKDALRTVLNRPMIGMTDVVGVGAGRPEWVYFKWDGHKKNWANHQNGAREDLLLTATRSFRKAGLKVAAIIDLYAPNYLKEHPEVAAVRYDGVKSPKQVSLIDVVNGNYGRIVLEMVEYISKNYPVDAINLTELSYYDYSYSSKDLESYEAHNGRKGWPLDSQGRIDREDLSIWEWKSEMLERFIKKVAKIAHKHGKELYVDVPVSWKDFKRNGKESGLDYKRILDYADKIIVWNYFYLEGAPPTVSETIASHLVNNLPISTFYVSVGLWGKMDYVDPDTFSEAIISTLKGGAKQIWVTPNNLLTEKHWNRLLSYLKDEELIVSK